MYSYTHTHKLYFFIKPNKTHTFANECMGNESKLIKRFIHSQTIKSVLSVTFFHLISLINAKIISACSLNSGAVLPEGSVVI